MAPVEVIIEIVNDEKAVPPKWRFVDGNLSLIRPDDSLDMKENKILSQGIRCCFGSSERVALEERFLEDVINVCDLSHLYPKRISSFVLVSCHSSETESKTNLVRLFSKR